MKAWDGIFDAIKQSTGSALINPQTRPTSGGCTDNTHIVSAGHENYFVKYAPEHAHSRFAAEAKGLAVLRGARAVRVPQVISCGITDAHAFLVLEYLNLGQGRDHTAAQLGQQLARQHCVTDTAFGWEEDNFIGDAKQSNLRQADWSVFWREARLRPQLTRATQIIGIKLAGEAEKLLESCGAFFTDYQPAPALLHGDLWDGNWGATADGAPVIFDPAVYFGDREADIAMTELFGRFPEVFYSAYRAAWPLDEGYPVRCELYNLYHVLNHLNLFGVGYLPQAERLILRLLAQLR